MSAETASARPLAQVYKADGAAANQVAVPAVLLTPIRPDVIHSVTRGISKNRRQPYAVANNAGEQTSAVSWGTGRAVSRIPRVHGGGTHRAGQGAFGNMCRGGRMYNPNKVWRRWHRRVNQNERRYAVASALAASAVPSLVMARGHRVAQVPEVPLVVDTQSLANVQKTREAVAVLQAVGAYEDVEKVKASRSIRAGKGKMRNRRYVQRRGPLVVYDDRQENATLVQAFRNLPGVELCSVHRLNLLQLAPGGHVGRFVVWTSAAFSQLDTVYGTYSSPSQVKKGWKLPRSKMTNSDITRIINSDEIQSVLRPAMITSKYTKIKRNPLRNREAMLKLNPHHKIASRQHPNASAAVKKARAPRRKAQAKAIKTSRKAFYKTLVYPAAGSQ
jgi:large subunit ribosomal protein L4e